MRRVLFCFLSTIRHHSYSVKGYNISKREVRLSNESSPQKTGFMQHFQNEGCASRGLVAEALRPGNAGEGLVDTCRHRVKGGGEKYPGGRA